MHGYDRTIVVHRMDRVIDDDLPEIAKAYKAFRAEHGEPDREL
jgi:type I restriction enzyme M protein